MTEPIEGSTRRVIFYERGRSPYPLAPSEREEIARAVGPFAREVLDDRTGVRWRDELIPAAEGGVVAVYRIEHLGRVAHRAVRLRRLAEVRARLYVHSGLPLPSDTPEALLSLADYTEALLNAERVELGILIRAGQARTGRHGGRPRKAPVSPPATVPEGTGAP